MPKGKYMERFRQLNIKDKGKRLFKAVVSAAKEFDQGVSWDLWESGKMTRMPLPEGIDLEAEKERIVHEENCWVGNTRVMIRESFDVGLPPVPTGYSITTSFVRTMQLECQMCEGRGPNLLKEPHLQGIRNSLLTFANEQRERARQEWMKGGG